MSKRFGAVILALVLALSMLTACATPKQTEAPKSDTPAPTETKPKTPAIFTATGGWDVPPAYNGNPFAAGGVGAANGWIYEPLFIYNFSTGELLPRLGTDWQETDKDVTIKLRQGVTWHDGTPFTAKDVVSTFYVGKLANWSIWNTLEKVEAVDDHTVKFTWQRTTAVAKQLINNERIRAPHHMFGKWADAVPPVMNDAAARDKLRADLLLYKPQTPVGTGIFQFKQVTASDMILDKNPKHYSADKVAFDQLKIVRNASDEVMWALMIAGELDVSHANAPKDVVDNIKARQSSMVMVTAPDLSDHGTIINSRVYPWSEQKFRQAFAYILDRDKIRQVSHYFSTTYNEYSTGLLGSFQDKWLSKEFVSKLTNYKTDHAKATKLLEEIGMTKKDKVWYGKDGKPLNIEVMFRPNWGVDAEAIASQLTAFGIPAKARAVEDSIWRTTMLNGDFQLTGEFGQIWWGHGDPWTGYNRFYNSDYAKYTGMPEVVKSYDGTEINLKQMVNELGSTRDAARRKQIVEHLAWVTNEYLPILAMSEKMLPIYTFGIRVTGWPAATDPLWQLAGGGTERVYTTLMMEGILQPVRK